MPKPKGKKRDAKTVPNGNSLFKLKISLSVISIIVSIFLTFLLIQYADNHQEFSSLLEFYSDKLMEILIALLAGEGFCLFKIKGTTNKILQALAEVWILVFIYIFILLCGFFRVYSSVTAPPKPISVEGIIDVNSTNVPFTKQHYIFENDPFIEHWDAYLGIQKNSVPQTEINPTKAELIIDDIHSLPDSTLSEAMLPKGYTSSTRLADKLYKFYVNQRNSSWDDPLDFARLQEERLKGLETCKRERENANVHYKCSDNLKNLAIYYKDEGDEHIRYILEVPDADSDAKHTDALNAYKTSAEYCMEAIRFAGANDNISQMSDILTIFQGIVTAVTDQQLENTLLGQNICEAYEVYTLVIAAWST